MAYFLLLALICSASFAFISFASKKPSSAHLVAGTGFLFLSLGFFIQIVLGFHLDESSAKLFFWARETLAIAWLGHALILLIFRKHPIFRWITFGLILGTVISLVLVGTSQMTRAEDWFQVAKPVYSQINELLALNRPTRWAAGLLSLYGFAALAAGAFYVAFDSLHKKRIRNLLVPALFIFGAVGLILPIWYPPSEASVAFFVVEISAPVAAFCAFTLMNSSEKISQSKR